MLYNPTLQKIINAAVILTLVGTVIIAVVGFVPTHSPIGPLIGKMSNAKTLSGLLGALDPKAVGKALAKEGEPFLTQLMGELDPTGTAIAINENTQWVSEVTELTSPFSTRLFPPRYLTTASMLNSPPNAGSQA